MATTDPSLDLQHLISHMQPILQDEEWVYVTWPSDTPLPGPTHGFFATVLEPEGLSVVLRRADALSLGLQFDAVFQSITLLVSSSLHATGLTAVVATALAQQQIPANVIAGHHHDHILVPQDRAAAALACLKSLAAAENPL